MQTFYKLSDKYQTNKSGVLSQFNGFEGKRQKRKLSKKPKIFFSRLKMTYQDMKVLIILLKILKLNNLLFFPINSRFNFFCDTN